MLDEVVKRPNNWPNIWKQWKCWASSPNIFDLCQISPNIESHDVGWPNMVVKRSNISPNMMLGEMLGEMLDRLTGALIYQTRVNLHL